MKEIGLLTLMVCHFGWIAPLSAQCVKLTTATIAATSNGQTIRDKYIKITTPGSKGILVNGFSGVKIRHCKIEYVIASYGIQFINAPNLSIDSCEIILTNPPTGAVPLTGISTVAQNSNCIDGYGSLAPIIKHVKMSNGSAGIFLEKCDAATIQWVTGVNFRGPKPRGQFIQFNKCKGGSIADFYNFNDLLGSYPEDNINFLESGGQTVSNGILDGNNSPTGQGILWEQQNVTYGYGGSAQNVDLINMGNGACSAQSAKNITFTNIYVREGHCVGKGGRATPASNGLEFWASASANTPTILSQNLQLLNCKILKTTTAPVQPCYTTGTSTSHYLPTTPTTIWTQTQLALVTSNPNRTIYQNNFTWTTCASKINYSNELGAIMDETLLIYPNPASSSIKFAGLADKTYQLIVKDIQGSEKLRQTIHLDSEISIQHLAEGIYFIRLLQDGELIGQKKLIKIK